MVHWVSRATFLLGVAAMAVGEGCTSTKNTVAVSAPVVSVPVVSKAPAAPTAADPPPDNSIPIHHFIYVIQENISYDHYFGTYPGGDGIPPGVMFAYLPGGTPQ